MMAAADDRYKQDPDWVAAQLENLHRDFTKGQESREAQLVVLTKMGTRVDALTDSVREMRDFATKVAIVFLGWAASALL